MLFGDAQPGDHLVESVSGAPALDLLADAPSPQAVLELLHEVIDPELGLDIVELGLVRSVHIGDGVARVRFTVTTPACPLSSYIEDEIRACLWQVPGVRELDIACELEPAWDPEDMSEAARTALGWAA
jgi:metal-sulfur cluster biosynthetic enzyme